MSEVKTPYWKKLENPLWQRKRLEVFERDDFTCRYCGSKENRLEVHHLYYVSGREPWQYPIGAFMTACSSCHREQKENASESNPQSWERFCELENVIHQIVEARTDFVSALNKRSDFIQMPPFELLLWIIDALDDGLIDHETIAKWRDHVRVESVDNKFSGGES